MLMYVLLTHTACQAGGGAQPHWHSTAWNWLVHGRKEWLLWPPSQASYAQRHVSLSLDGLNASDAAAAAFTAFTAPASIAAAATTTATTTAATAGATAAAAAAVVPPPLRCEQRAGDVLIVPEVWGHATRNLEPSLGWATEISFDRSYEGGFSETHGDEWWRVAGRPAPREPRDPPVPRAAATTAGAAKVAMSAATAAATATGVATATTAAAANVSVLPTSPPPTLTPSPEDPLSLIDELLMDGSDEDDTPRVASSQLQQHRRRQPPAAGSLGAERAAAQPRPSAAPPPSRGASPVVTRVGGAVPALVEVAPSLGDALGDGGDDGGDDDGGAFDAAGACAQRGDAPALAARLASAADEAEAVAAAAAAHASALRAMAVEAQQARRECSDVAQQARRECKDALSK